MDTEEAALLFDFELVGTQDAPVLIAEDWNENFVLQLDFG